MRSKRWAEYYRHHERRPVSPLLKRAMTHLPAQPQPRQAVDLGCGSGSETRFLLEAGWDVFAVDQEPGAIERVRNLQPADSTARLETKVSSFEALDTLPESMLIHAGLSLPFCHPRSFPELWRLILSALGPGGVFVGHLFGDRDGWSANPNLTFHTAEEVAELLTDLNIHYLHEVDEDGSSMQGPKHWHRFDIVATSIQAEVK
ncbi:class I SAM-dependent methyltransferase [Natronospirillum operosum]|uniref:Class I SAM-dependent methyltransferase n=2 Tax=Natronospirillum operosum TaxID=2759953 RepID=A0A4Z0WA00_9GAMM|nr:class I SAM-dependent methyltransferase [Natronospirillum operosum]